MFELGVITDEISQDLDHALDVVREWGLTWVELRTMWDTNIVDLDAAAVDRLHAAIRDRGLRVAAISSPVLKCALPGFPTAQRGDTFHAAERDFPTHLHLLERAAELAHRFDTRFIRVFSFWAVPDREAAWTAILDHFQPLIDIAAREDITLVVENEHVCNVATGAQARRLLDDLDSPRVRAVWDPANAFVTGVTAYPDDYAHIRPYTVHVHVKDAVRDSSAHGYSWRPVGDGDVNLGPQLQALKDDGYTGVVSLETHYVPQGGAKEQGSREAFAGLQRLVANLH